MLQTVPWSSAIDPKNLWGTEGRAAMTAHCSEEQGLRDDGVDGYDRNREMASCLFTGDRIVCSAIEVNDMTGGGVVLGQTVVVCPFAI